MEINTNFYLYKEKIEILPRNSYRKTITIHLKYFENIQKKYYLHFYILYEAYEDYMKTS